MAEKDNQYDKKGGYAGYNANNKDRQKEDYYATPTEEVINILNILKPFEQESTNINVLEPTCGEGHMIKGILKYCELNNINMNLYGTDLIDRGYKNEMVNLTYGDDFLKKTKEDFPLIDYIIMNPPYKNCHDFIAKALQISNKGVLALVRLQFLEGQKRYEKIFKDNPPSKVYVYIDRICCAKNGDFEKNNSKIQPYCWCYWDLKATDKTTNIEWIYSINKKPLI